MRRVAAAAIGIALLAACASAPSRVEPAPPVAEPALRWQDAKLLAEAFERIQSEYVDEVASRALAIEALRGLLAGLDPHSAYLSPEEYAALAEYTDGGPLEPSPTAPRGAGGAGATGGSSTEDARTPAGGEAAPAAQRSPDAVRTAAPSVIATLPRPGLVHLRIGQFNVTTAAELEREIDRLRAGGALAGVALDLRGNTGGVYGAAGEVADLFIDGGVLFRAEGRAAGTSFERAATPGDALAGAPLIVLVDGATASAAEIVAGALQDRGRALLLGARTFGKGSVQSVIPLRSGGAIKFTTARYRLPSGRAIDGQGLEPDLPLAALARRPGSVDPALEHALDSLAAAARARR